MSDLQAEVMAGEEGGLIDGDAVKEQVESLELLPPEVSDDVLGFVDALPEDFMLPVPDGGENPEQEEELEQVPKAVLEQPVQSGN